MKEEGRLDMGIQTRSLKQANLIAVAVLTPKIRSRFTYTNTTKKKKRKIFKNKSAFPIEKSSEYASTKRMIN
jgi:hypothetical protein